MLKEYHRKRDFEITPEPSGTDKKTRPGKFESLTFVIQKHAARRLHYDFRLEIDGVMVSWAVPKGPSLDPAEKRLAIMTEDHPMEYAEFEGIIPEKQYGAGEVIIWDRGLYSPDEDKVYSWDKHDEANKRMRDGLKKGKLSFFLKGSKLHGSWTLVKIGKGPKEWLLIKHHDQYEDPKTDITEDDLSVISGQTIEDLQEHGAENIWTAEGKKSADPKTSGRSSKKRISKAAAPAKDKDGKQPEKTEGYALINSGKKSRFPSSIPPMLATLADGPFQLEGWFFEPKLDGVRAIAYIRDGKCRLSSRRGKDLSDNYPIICEHLEGYMDNIVIDGEVVALNSKGQPSFQLLQQSSGGLRSFRDKTADKEKTTLVYYIFDVLYARDRDVTQLELIDRKKILRAILRTNDVVRLVRSLGDDGHTAFDACVELGLEGIIGKQEQSKYLPGVRTKSWLKVKTSLSAEFLICGFTRGTGGRAHTFGSLLLGEYDKNGDLQFVGGVGTGFNTKTLEALQTRMRPLIRKTCPFEKAPTGRLQPTWLKPELVAEVQFLERTQDNMLRAPVFIHIREDLEPSKVKNTGIVHVRET